MSKHTPGPWEALQCEQTPDRGAVYVNGSRGWDVDPVCSTYEHNDRETNEANARLIAAAPDLLEACRWALTNAIAVRKHDSDTPYVAALRAAIAKTEKP